MTDETGWSGLLQEGEAILWQGQPDPAIDWRGVLSPLSLFGAVFALFSLGWMTFAASLGGGTGVPILGFAFALFGLPFLGIGLYMLAGRLWVDAWRRRKTWYTLTTHQAFVAEELLGRKGLTPYAIAEMPPIELVDGRPGDVIFGTITHSQGPRRPGPNKSRYRLAGSTVAPLDFFRIHDARKVWALLRDRRAALIAAMRANDPEGER
jgi:hypothetical protein